MYNQTSPFSLKKYNKAKSSKLINQKYIKNNSSSSTENIKALFSNEIPSIKKNSNLFINLRLTEGDKNDTNQVIAFDKNKMIAFFEQIEKMQEIIDKMS